MGINIKIYEYKGRTYTLMGALEHKDITTRKWIKTVRYIQNETGNTYSREEKEFYRLFKRVS